MSAHRPPLRITARARFPLLSTLLSLLSGWMGRSVDAAPLRRVRGALEEPLIGSLQPAGKGRGDAPELSAVLKLRREPCFVDESSISHLHIYHFRLTVHKRTRRLWYGSTFHFNIHSFTISKVSQRVNIAKLVFRVPVLRFRLYFF